MRLLKENVYIHQYVCSLGIEPMTLGVSGTLLYKYDWDQGSFCFTQFQGAGNPEPWKKHRFTGLYSTKTLIAHPLEWNSSDDRKTVFYIWLFMKA